MSAARIMVFFEGELVEDTVLTVSKSLWVGDAENARVCFPGWTLALGPHRDGMTVNHEFLKYGEKREFKFQGVTIRLESVRVSELPRDPIWRTDLRFPILMMATFLVLMSFQTASDVVSARLERGPMIFAGWVVVPAWQEVETPTVNPQFDLDAVGRTGTYQPFVSPNQVPSP